MRHRRPHRRPYRYMPIQGDREGRVSSDLTYAEPDVLRAPTPSLCASLGRRPVSARGSAKAPWGTKTDSALGQDDARFFRAVVLRPRRRGRSARAALVLARCRGRAAAGARPDSGAFRLAAAAGHAPTLLRARGLGLGLGFGIDAVVKESGHQKSLCESALPIY